MQQQCIPSLSEKPDYSVCSNMPAPVLPTGGVLNESARDFDLLSFKDLLHAQEYKTLDNNEKAFATFKQPLLLM